MTGSDNRAVDASLRGQYVEYPIGGYSPSLFSIIRTPDGTMQTVPSESAYSTISLVINTRKFGRPDKAGSVTHIFGEVLPRQRGALGDQICRGALEDDATAVMSGARSQVDDPVGVRHDRLVMLDHDHRLA